MSNTFYVYTHSFNGEVFYIGKGTGNRYKHKSSRNAAWKDIVGNNFNEVEIGFIVENVTETMALEIELAEINSNKYPFLCNVATETNTSKEVPLEVLHKYLEYSEHSPSGLIRKINSGPAKAGDTAGHYTKNYWKVKLDSQSYLAHRLVYAIHFGQIPKGLVIDHIDCNTSNNLISNLRLCTQSGNIQYREESGYLRKDNTSGIKGISTINKAGNIVTVVQWSEKGVRRSREFSHNKYGEKEALDVAISFKMWLEEGNTYEVPMLRHNNTSGVTGVCERDRNGIKSVRVSWSEKGKTRSKEFSYNKYGGREKTWDIAIEFKKNLSK